MPIRITATRGSSLGSLPNTVTPVKIAFVGQTLGADVWERGIPLDATDRQNVGGDTTGYTGAYDVVQKDSTTVAEVKAISRISTGELDEINTFRAGVDYALVAPNKIHWLNAPLGSPYLSTSVTTGGAVTSGTKYFIVYAEGLRDYDYSLKSNDTTCVVTATNNKVVLNWDKVEFATGYAVCYSSDNTTWNPVNHITDGATTTLVITADTGLATVAGTFNFSTNLIQYAVRKPDGTFYVDYKGVAYDYTASPYTSLKEVLINHGIGSDLTNMSRIAFNEYGLDEIYLCGVDGTGAQAFNDAIDKISNIENVQYVVALTDIDNVHRYNVNQARINSQDTMMKERFALVANDLSTNIETLLTWVESFSGEKRAIPVICNSNLAYMNTYQKTDGSSTDNKLVRNAFLAGAVGCDMVSKAIANSVINDTVNGFNFGAVAPAWIDSVEKDKFRNAGSTYIMSKNGRMTLYNDNTNDASIPENFERSVISAEDEMRRRLRASGQRYIGKPIIDLLLSAIYSSTSDTLSKCASDSVIRGFRGLEVVQDTTTPTKVNVTFVYTAIYPLLEIEFNYGFDL